MPVAQSIKIGKIEVGSGAAPFIVAEISGNHNGELSRALEIVDAAAAAGAHAVKLQTYTADTITIDHDGPGFRVSEGHELWGGSSLYELYERAHTPWEWHAEIFAHARSLGLIPFSSPFDASAVDLLESLDVEVYKIASLEIADIALLRRVARTGKPVILSNGASTPSDLDLAISTIRNEGNNNIIVLACTSSYPAPPEESNLRSIPLLQDAFQVPVGLSDHTLGIGVAVAAVALGACVIEKHVTLDRNDGGVDSEFSLEPSELVSLVIESKRAWMALGTPTLYPTAGEKESSRLRRSLYVVEDVHTGDIVTEQNVRAIRPAGGLEPVNLDLVLGRTFQQDVKRGTPLAWPLV